jgi:MFS family permease
VDANDRALTAVAMLGHATFHTYELVVPLFVALWLGEFAVTAAELGLLVGAGFALVGVGALPAGVLADRYDSKRLIVGSVLGMGGGFVVLSAAPNAAVLGVGLALWGAAASVYHPAGLSLISRGASERGTAFAYHGLAGNAGVAVGPLLGAVLLAFLHWRTVAVVLVLPAAVAAAVGRRIEVDEGAATADADGRATAPADAAELVGRSRRLFAGGFALAFVVAVLYGLYYRGAFTFLPDVLADVPLFAPVPVAGATLRPSQYAYAGLLAVGGAGQYVGGKLSDRVAPERALAFTFAVLVAVSLAFVPALSGGVASLLAVCALFGFVAYAVAPMYQSTIAAHAPSDAHGLSFGYTYLGTFGVGALGASAAGVVLTYADAAALFTLLAVPAGLAAVVAVVLVVRREGERSD